MFSKTNNIPRRDMLKYGAATFVGFVAPATPARQAEGLDDALLLHEVKGVIQSESVELQVS